MAAPKSKPARWRISQDLRDQLTAAGAQLDEELAQLREWQQGATYKWQDSDEGTAVVAWLENLDQLGHMLDENLDVEPLAPKMRRPPQRTWEPLGGNHWPYGYTQDGPKDEAPPG